MPKGLRKTVSRYSSLLPPSFVPTHPIVVEGVSILHEKNLVILTCILLYAVLHARVIFVSYLQPLWLQGDPMLYNDGGWRGQVCWSTPGRTQDSVGTGFGRHLPQSFEFFTDGAMICKGKKIYY